MLTGGESTLFPLAPWLLCSKMSPTKRGTFKTTHTIVCDHTGGNMKLFNIVLAIATALVVAQANAGVGLHLGQPGYGGNGCPAGTASAILSPDEQELSVLFDQYLAEAGGITGKNIDRKSCNLTIPVVVPQGYSVAVFKVDYRGYLAIPAGGRAQFDAEYFWAGTKGPKVSRSASGPYNDIFTITDNLLATTIVWSACGDSLNLRINSSMMAQTNPKKQQVIAQVDSADISSALVYHLQWRRCN